MNSINPNRIVRSAGLLLAAGLLASPAGLQTADAQTADAAASNAHYFESEDVDTRGLLQKLERSTIRVRLPRETLPQALHFDRLSGQAPSTAAERAGTPLDPTDPNAQLPEAVWSVATAAHAPGLVLVPQPLYTPAAQDIAFEVELPGGERATARFVGSDVLTRLTLLRLEDAATFPPTVRLARARPELGEQVVFLPAGRELAQLRLWTGGRQQPGLVLRADAQDAGLLGYVTPDAQYVHIADCGPVLEQLVEFGRANRPILGMMVLDETRARPELHVGGLPPEPRLLVKQVFNDSRADRAGLRAGDELISMGGMPVKDLVSLSAAIAAARGETLVIIRRDGEAHRLSLQLHGER